MLYAIAVLHAVYAGDLLACMAAAFTVIGWTGLTVLTYKAMRANTRFSRRGILRFWRIGRLQISWCIASRGVVR